MHFKRPHSYLMAALAAGIAVSTCAADQPDTALQLRTTLLEMPNLGVNGTNARIANLAARPDLSYGIIRLHAEVEAPQRLKLADEGIELLSCLGPKTWTVSIDSELATGEGRFGDRIAWIGELPNRAKLHPDLAAGIVPEWTVDRRTLQAFERGEDFDPVHLLEQLAEEADPVVALYVLAHRNVELERFGEVLSDHLPVEIRSTIVTMNGLLVRVPMSAVDHLVEIDEVFWVEPALPPLTSRNDSNRANTLVEEVWAAPYGLSGADVTVMVYDGGTADASHPDFGGRLSVHDSSGTGTHATHVSGTVGGDGTNSGGQNAGMAPGCTIVSFGFEQEGGLSEGFLYTDPGDIELDYGYAIQNLDAVVANNSIGTNTAYNGFPCDWTGDYGVTSGVIDSVARGALGGDIRIVWANGNERGSTRCGDLYYSTAPPACAKNSITVGALNSNDDSVTYFTSWGPTDDGRIKPDVSAPGCQSDVDGGVTSTFPGGGYGTYCGTSMASPTVAGITALIVEAWRQQYPEKADLLSSSVKALLATTGDDLGNEGPDCQYGYGTVRAQNAIDALRDDGIIEGEVGDGDVVEHLVIVSGSDDMLRITLAWDDEPAAPLPVAALVNDLDLVVTSPAGEIVFPWTINPDDPGAPATRSGEDHSNNMEQVSVASPMSGAWRVQIRGTSVPVGPQAYSVAATPSPTACSSTGVAGFDGSAFQPNSTVGLTVVDCDLNLSDTEIDTVTVLVWSDDETTGESVVLSEEEPLAAVFTGTIEIADRDAAGVLHAVHGSEIVLEYEDAESADGSGPNLVIATARVDGVIDAPTGVDVPEFGPDSATVSIATTEPVRVRIMYGLSCDSLTDEVVRNSYSTDHLIEISGLEDTFTYYFRIELTDQAGNVGEYGDGADCYSFTVPDALDFFAESFSTGVDLVDLSVRFVPIGGADVYAPCAEPITTLPIDPTGGSSLSLGDDSYQEVSLPFTFEFYEENWNSVFVGSNGYATFGSGSTDYSESFADHFLLAGISALFDDLNPSIGGTISTKSVSGAFAITWQDVPEYSTTNQNTFQIVLYESGELAIAWTQVDALDAIVGLSPGGGQDGAFIPSDLSESFAGCLPRPPTANDLTVTTAPGAPVDISLAASDDGAPEPLIYVVETLPLYTLRDLASGEVITSVPHVILGGDGPHLQYEPSGLWEGSTSFTYYADDGGTPPDGGASNTATVSILVVSGPSVIYEFLMDENPGFTLEGNWDHGQPTGGGGQYGSPDPTSGYTGANVLGYNLGGDYDNSMPEYSATTPSLDCSDLSGVTLRFMRWLNVETSSYDHAYLRVSADGGLTYQTIWENSSEVTSSSWTEFEYDIADIADGQPDVRIRWVMGTTDSSWQYSGWNLDDVQVIAMRPSEGVPGDLDDDFIVGGSDLAILLAAWGRCAGCRSDLNGDGFVDGIDLTLLLGYWTSTEGHAATNPGDSRPDHAVSAPTWIQGQMPLINDGRLAPVDHGGVIVAPHGFIQTPDGVLEIELAGSLPIEEHDLVLIEGSAVLAGQLEVHLDLGDEEEGSLHVILLSDSIDGAFEDVRLIGDGAGDPRFCRTERALVVLSGDAGVAALSETPATVSEALDLIDALGLPNRAWDLDGDGEVTLEDLRILLIEDIACE